MNTDTTRGLSVPKQHLHQTINQQGRIQVDGDWNGQAQVILRYFQAYPHAMDTLEGIAQWWLAKNGTRSPAAQIEAVLADLVVRGWIAKRRGENGHSYYYANGASTPEIENYLTSVRMQKKQRKV